MKIYRRSGFEKHRLVSIAYALEGLSPLMPDGDKNFGGSLVSILENDDVM